MVGSSTYVILVGVAARGVANFLRVGLLAFRLDGRCDRVGGALDAVAGLLSGRLLRVGLQRLSQEMKMVVGRTDKPSRRRRPCR